MRFQRTPRRCGVGVVVVVSAISLLAPGYAGATTSSYGPKVEPALAELAQAADAGFTETQGQRESTFRTEQQQLQVDALEQRRQREEAARDAEAQLDTAMASVVRDRDVAFARAQASRTKAFHAKLRILDTRFKRELRQYRPEVRTRLAAKHAKRTAALERAFRAQSERLVQAHKSSLARLAAAYAAGQAQRAAALKADLEQLDSSSATALADRESAFATDHAARESEHAAMTLPALAFGTDVSAARDQVGATLRHELSLIDAQALTVRLGDIRRLAEEPGISYLSADVATEPTATAPLPAYSLPALESLFPGIVGATAAWAMGYTGAGIGVAVLDSGVAPLADFTGRLTHAVVPGLADAANDQLGHGSFVASVAAGRSTDGRFAGVAPGAKIFAINVSRGNSVLSSDVIKGLEWVLANRAAPRNIRVVVLSLTESLPSSYQTSALDFAVEKLWNKGVVVVASAGNSGPDTMQFAPANDPYAITVGASDPNGTAATADDVLASFSSYGKTIDGHAKPDVLAPGRNVVAALPEDSTLDLMAPDANHIAPGYVRMNGTSVSSPQVAGAVAILLQQNPSLTPDQVKWLLVTHSRPVTGSSANSIDVARALAYNGAVGRANVGINFSVGPVREGDDDDRKSEFNAGALREALSWEKAAGKLEKMQAPRWSKAAEAWEEAAQLWVEKLDVAYKSAVDYDLGANAWVKAGKWANAAGAWERAGSSAERVPAWQSAATYLGLAAGAWESTGDYTMAALAWEHASRASESAAALPTATFENKAIAWIKAVSALENAAAAWKRAAALDKSAAAETRRLALRAQAVAWANATWTNATWTNATWTNATWTNATWLNATWTNATWTNATWTNATWTNATWTSATWE
jgi:serine protease AprX